MGLLTQFVTQRNPSVPGDAFARLLPLFRQTGGSRDQYPVGASLRLCLVKVVNGCSGMKPHCVHFGEPYDFLPVESCFVEFGFGRFGSREKILVRIAMTLFSWHFVLGICPLGSAISSQISSKRYPCIRL
jgi:hypothetical protein